MERSFVIDSTQEKLVLSKATEVRLPTRMLHLDELGDKTWRLTYTTSLLEDFRPVQALRLHGLENGVPRPCKGVTLELVGLGVVLSLAKVVAVKTPARLFQLTEGAGGWMLLYSMDLLPEVQRVRELRVVRIDD